VKANFELGPRGAYFGNVDVKLADRVGLEFVLFASAGDAMPLQERCKDDRVKCGIVA
jgi:hypothetical protein